MINIVDDIRKKCITYETETGKKPVSVYLGKLEWELLKRATFTLNYGNYCYDNIKLMFEGKHVYIVEEFQHLNVV